ncbi:MAG: CAP domain-containing protein [Leptolyngbyaceae cyanobacterium]
MLQAIKFFTPLGHRWLRLTVMGLLVASAIAIAPTLTAHETATAIAQSRGSHPFAGHSIVYVQTGDRWREAFIAGISSRVSHGQAAWTYTVNYLDAAGGGEANIPSGRLATIETAQAQGLTANVYDLSAAAGIEQMLTAHNAARQAVDVADLTWSADLAAYAQEWAEQLIQAGGSLRHRPAADRAQYSVGENLSSSQSSAAGGAIQHPSRVVAAWVAEQADYDYASNSCASGKICGHYTQIVWRETTEVGCGVARNDDATREVWVCNYSPAGNYIGERPY